MPRSRLPMSPEENIRVNETDMELSHKIVDLARHRGELIQKLEETDKKLEALLNGEEVSPLLGAAITVEFTDEPGKGYSYEVVLPHMVKDDNQASSAGALVQTLEGASVGDVVSFQVDPKYDPVEVRLLAVDWEDQDESTNS